MSFGQPTRQTEEDHAVNRDFNTDDAGRYPRGFLRGLNEGRTYEDLQTPDRLRRRDIQRKFDAQDVYLPTVESLVRYQVSATFTSSHATADLEVPHNLGVVPSTLLIGISNADARIWKGTKEWTRTNLYLRASAACTVTLFPVV